MQNTLSDFEPSKVKKRIAEETEDQKIMDLLGRFTAEMLKDALVNEDGHPKPEWGDGDTWRFYYIDECRRRGRRLLEQLGWTADENAEYVNLHTGSVQTLWEVATSCGYNSDKYTLDTQVWSVIEHWEPYDKSKPNRYLINYLKNELKRLNKILSKDKSKLGSYEKSDIKKIPKYEKIIEEEESKNKGDKNHDS